MPLMKAVQVKQIGADLSLVEKEIPKPQKNEVLLRVQACGVCHGDTIPKEGQFPGLQYPRIPGHEVVGLINRLGPEVQDWNIGQRVGVGWHGGHCFHCPACRAGDFLGCKNSMSTGVSIDGGYAEYMVARAEALVAIPDGLSSVEAAPLLCAGSTTLGALKSCIAKGGDLVAIHGLGGLGHLALQFAVRLGFKTAVLSRGREKENLARQLGAHHFIDTNQPNMVKELMMMGGARAIICTAPNSQILSELIGGLAPGGQMIIITFVNEPMQLFPPLLMMGRRSISGWVGGNMADALNFSVLTGIVPLIEIFPLEQAPLAYERMITSKVHFRGVLKVEG
ncbi:MAG: alcohol dehydrogenase catalytic domain-containing protein [Nitrospiria bacterium]